MAHDISEAKIRLSALEASEKKRKHKKAADDLGFDVVADYDAWKVLNDLREATLRVRREKADAEAAKKVVPQYASSNGGIYINSVQNQPWR